MDQIEIKSSIQNNLRALEKEKFEMEANLQKLWERKEFHQQCLNTKRTNLNEVIDSQSRLKENINVAKFKADKLVAQAQSFENNNQKLRERIDTLQGKILESKQEQLHKLDHFEKQLKELRDTFVEAVTYYSNEQMLEDKSKTENEQDIYQQKIEEVDKQVQNINKEFHNLSLVPVQKQWETEIPMEQRKMILRLFEAEDLAIISNLELLKKQRKQLQEETDLLLQKVALTQPF